MKCTGCECTILVEENWARSEVREDEIVHICEACDMDGVVPRQEPPIVMGGQGHDSADLVEAGKSLALMAALVVVTVVIAMLRGS